MSETMSEYGTEGSSGDSREPNTDALLAVTSSIRARASVVAASLNSPTKAGKAMSKKQQKLAEAAKTSRNISQYFSKKQTTETLQTEVKEGLDATHSCTNVTVTKDDSQEQTVSPVTVEDVEIRPLASDTQGAITESKPQVITIYDDEEELSHKTQTLGQDGAQNTREEPAAE